MGRSGASFAEGLSRPWLGRLHQKSLGSQGLPRPASELQVLQSALTEKKSKKSNSIIQDQNLKMHSEITDVIYELQEENDENEKKISK
jgi:hypothetical protein